MADNVPRDRWVGASPGGNVTPGGKALEALHEIKRYVDEHLHGDEQLTDGERAVLTDIDTAIKGVNLDG